MAVPKRKISKARRNSRKANWKLTAPNLVECSKCGELMMSHRACKSCGTYNKREVVKVED
ncbi:50S ribosomal protein L32 [Vallitalea okinawensis]|uniref:50S ribosomal protein L32 n=1 Tax=Vallitalea okinawensis TaxID=2078660 RepID=UPI000CFBE1F1|nr:50S ribosomal protein L32 [Vallitalea okinawensis]